MTQTTSPGATSRSTPFSTVLAPKRMTSPSARIALTKDVALVSVIAVGDVVSVARDAQSVTFNSSTLVAAGLFYLVFTLPLIWLLDRIIAREQRRTGFIGMAGP